MTASPTASPDRTEPSLRCDFCGQVAPSLRRIALDRDYERLRTPHREQFACSECSEKKERQRLGLDRRGR